MSRSSIGLDDRLEKYLRDNSLRELPLLAELRAETGKMTSGGMQISPEQGQFMALFTKLIGAKRAVEVGTFTGYSSLCVANALPADGKLICCDISEEYTNVARRYWDRAGLGAKIDLKIGPALDSLKAVATENTGKIDLAFIDADKTNYANYYEAILGLLRPGGVVLVDNVLWSGAVADPDDNKPDTVAIRAFNAKLKDDQRVEMSLLPVGDGLTIARKL